MEAFVHFVVNHWFFAIPMFGMMIAAGVMVIWRMLLNHNAKTDMNLFLPRFQEAGPFLDGWADVRGTPGEFMGVVLSTIGFRSGNAQPAADCCMSQAMS